jgi:hypothetical protein
MYRVFGWDQFYGLKKKVLWFDVTMDNSTFLMEIANSMSDLEYDVPGEVFAKVGQFNNLMKEFSSFHYCENQIRMEGKEKRMTNIRQSGNNGLEIQQRSTA